MIYDTIIIGAGSAGCSAAIYATRYNLKTLLIGGPMPGGLITEALDVENYPGYLSISGMELAKNFLDQAIKLGAEYTLDIVMTVKKNSDGLFEISTTNQQYISKTIILATGTHHRKLNVDGEQLFAGKGVSYCATCDAPFFKGKRVAVIGGGNSAVEGAIDLSVHASQVYIIYRSELKAAPVYIDQLRKITNITEIKGANITKIIGLEKVNAVELDISYNNSQQVELDGVFIQIGYVPQNELAKSLGLDLSVNGYVKVDAGFGTSQPGVFCAGDLNNGSNMLHQQVTSAAEGAISAQSTYRYVLGMSYLVTED